MNNNFQSTIKKSSAIIVAVVFLLCSLSIPAFADLVSSHDWTDLPITGQFSASSTSWESSQKLWNNNDRNIGIGNASGEGFMTACFTKSGDNVFRILFISNTSLSTGTAIYSYYSGNNQSFVVRSGTVGCSNVYHNDNNQFDLYYGWLNWSYISTSYSAQGGLPSNIRTYDGVDMADISPILQDAYTYILGHENEPPYEESPYYLSFSLNPGYVAFIDISDLTNVEVNLSTTLFSGSDWNNHTTDQNIGVLTSLPSSFSLPIAGTSHISWSGYGNTNILGQYKSFHAPYTYTTAGSGYLCIVNPLQARQSAQLTAMASMPSARNNPINVSVSLARAAKIYSLTATLDIGSGTLDTESNGSTNSGSPDAEGQWQWNNDQTGQPIDPNDLPIGGGNDPIIGQETSINDWLQDIANQIKGFFSGAIGAVTTLVSAGSAFINSLVSLYSWLPGSVYAVLSSALILVITIGVIKVFI